MYHGSVVIPGLEVVRGKGAPLGEFRNRRTRSDKQNRLDLKARNHKGEFIIIEVQYDFQLDYMHRILYSAARTVTEHLGSGHPYGEVVKVISVSILHFDLGHGEDYVYHGTTGFRKTHPPPAWPYPSLEGIHCNDTLEQPEAV